MVRLLMSVLCALVVGSGSAAADTSSSTYLLSPGDKVMISVWQEDTLRQETVVLPDGSITFPLAGRVDVAGLEATAVAKKIETALKPYLAQPNVSVVVTSTAGNLVYVQGKVIKPGPVPMAGPTAVLQALSMSGGMDKFADESAIKVIRGQKVMPVRYKDLVSGRDMSTNFQLQAGDTLVVP
ncbi:polysaccharide biosynthesis/export family protein [Pseudomonas vlassakiae]|jgi:polysaccharide export outer membrane protein|uniref:Polysaccharide biosynthesis/export family protein n=1 Tax=Pseudomonas vlassakiae TaxID=485888 RepID=A0A923K5B3_9PSED|nr:MULTISPECIES: polysaccharide biosynthesis/export family protein [Pseudomonas]AXQ48063.1 sugar ABC transporter substrate-binding protein [Stenotrophomonas rhizophila]MBH3410589.1 polysaccharide biosynthesis/export family protein [Pseudomonas putida]MBS3184969.1 polysaccharide biosynthesis/export family protein [Pseudomonas sp. PCH44]MBV4543041.1 polysaccharide biosynthesis/export family protein [Pseudomonas vlassakiae]MCU0125327.1 polysaccharide biosynthesis/export family protein [Pseudomona